MQFGQSSRLHWATTSCLLLWSLGAASLQHASAQDTPASITFPAAVAGPVHYPPQMRTRLLRILEGEWIEGGSYTIAANGTGHPAAAPEQGAPAAFGRIQAYWSGIPSMASYIEFNRRLLAYNRFGGIDAKAYCAGYYQGRDSAAHIWGCIPWSAAFVSWVFDTTGVLQSEFPRSASHREYVDALLSIYQDRGEYALFIPRNNGSYSLKPGDLICSDRTPSATARLRNFEDRIAETQTGTPPGRPMHCDIVSDVGPTKVGAIGGNVRDRVAKTTYSIDRSNHLTGNDRDVFVIFENRIGT